MGLGGSEGLERLATGFENYNGRYLGNIFILLVSKSNIIKTLIMTIVIISIPVVICKLTNKNPIIYFFALFLMYAMPVGLYAQTLGWASGFANYIIPVLSVLLYLLLIKNIFDSDVPKYKKYSPIIAFVLGVFSALFMENITLFNIGLGFLVILFVAIKYKKVYATHISFTVAAVIGALIMFSNSAYRTIANGDDGYRSIGNSLSDIIGIISDNFGTVYANLIQKNVALNLTTTLLLLVIVAFTLKTDKHKKLNRYAIYLFTIINVTYVVFSVSLNVHSNWAIMLDSVPNITNYFKLLFAVLYYLSLIILPLLCIKDLQQSIKICASVLFAGALVIPLFFVNPLNARCFFPSYAMQILYACQLVSYICPKINIKKVLSIATISGCIGILVLYTPVVLELWNFNNERLEYVQEQIEDGQTEVYLPRYANELNDFIWFGTPPDETLWKDRFKDFYNIDENIDIVPIDYIEYKEKLKNE